MCVAKIHRATVTDANLNYVGSITIDLAILQASGIRERQYVNITNLHTGAFWRTYVMKGEFGSGVICLNGTAARHFSKGDKIIILAEAFASDDEFAKQKLTVVHVDEKNTVTRVEYLLP